MVMHFENHTFSLDKLGRQFNMYIGLYESAWFEFVMKIRSWIENQMYW